MKWGLEGCGCRENKHLRYGLQDLLDTPHVLPCGNMKTMACDTVNFDCKPDRLVAPSNLEEEVATECSSTAQTLSSPLAEIISLELIFSG